MSNEIIYNQSIHSVYYDDVEKTRFIEEYSSKYNLSTIGRTLVVENITVYDLIKEFLEDKKDFLVLNRTLHEIIIKFLDDKPTFILISTGQSVHRNVKGGVGITMLGPFDRINELMSFFTRRFKDTKDTATIDWWFLKADGNSDHTSFSLSDCSECKNEYYPWIEEGINEYFDRFMNASASVLFMTGLPGTGKTSLLRYWIASKALNVSVGYDQRLFANDTMFLSYLKSSQVLMILEDAENLTHSRENERNEMMSRFLNVSDGLVKLPKKKFIFTTNSRQFSEIDDALLRPGRCFGFLDFRYLTKSEARKAAQVAGVDFNCDCKNEYSLAEIFNSRNVGFKKEKVGFV